MVIVQTCVDRNGRVAAGGINPSPWQAALAWMEKLAHFTAVRSGGKVEDCGGRGALLLADLWPLNNLPLPLYSSCC
jgi:hypothetical protein